jgi:acyl carrier protein
MSDDNTAEILALFKAAVWEIDQKRLDELTADDAISSLGIDSVAMLEIIGYLEDELDIHLSDESLAKVETVGDLAAVIARQQRAA